MRLPPEYHAEPHLLKRGRYSTCKNKRNGILSVRLRLDVTLRILDPKLYL
jgi:hypothetical protein